jgi:pimeloyl-ACP methyl ester carboxylesterase
VSVGGIVLVHGGLNTSACWDSMLAHLELPVVALDLPGRGSHPAEITEVTLDDCVQAVIDFADQAGFEQFALVGHSLGGVTVTETAWRHPERVVHLVYVGALVPAPGTSASIAWWGVDMPAGEPVTVDGELAHTLFGNDLSEERWAELWSGFVPEADALMNARLSGYPDGVPVTYVSMTEDVAVPPALAEQMMTNLGVPVEHRLLSAGHMVMVSKPRELAAIINDVVRRA